MDLYEILSISPNATNDEIIKAYRKLAKIYHPDKSTGNTAKFQQINYAYNILINDTTKLQYNDMKKPTKNKFTKFLDEWFNKRPDIKSYFNINDTTCANIMENISAFDFNDLLGLFNKMKEPTKSNNTIDCSDSETQSWDETQAEYYNINDLPLKYHVYNTNNIKIELKTNIEDINSSTIRKIKINRRIDNTFVPTEYNFNCISPYIVFNMGGDNNGHLIISLLLPKEYTWSNDIIYYNININLYQYINGLDIPKFNICNWIPYKDGSIIHIKYINISINNYKDYILAIKLNTIYNNTNDNMELLKKFNYDC